jgi:type IV secretory pathway VirB9-like protein
MNINLIKRSLAFALGVCVTGSAAQAATPRYDSQGVFLFSYGNPNVPTITCSPTKVCELVLEPDEIVFKIYSGDTVRWIINPGFAGSKANIPTVLFKPVDVGPPDDPIQTNLIITTNRRTYEVNLLSVKQTSHTRYGFSYPQEAFMVTPTVNNGQPPVYDTPAPVQTMPPSHMQSLTGMAIQVARTGPPPRPDTYDIEGYTSYRPVAVWNDGVHTYIQMPPKAPAPSIYTQSASGTIEMINFHPPIDDVYTLDGTPDHIVLIGDIGKHVPHIDIVKK